MRSSARHIILLLACLVAAPLSAGETQVQRLASLGRVWSFVKHAHPYMGQYPIDWDGAGVSAIRTTLGSSGDEALLEATRAMLAELGDPATRVVSDCIETGPPVERQPRVLDDGALYIPPGAAAEVEVIRNASHVIFDLRPGPGRCTSEGASLLDTIAPLMFHGTITAPAHRRLAHSGYKSQNPAHAELRAYGSEFILEEEATFTGSGVPGRRTTFVVDQYASLPAVAVAMVHAGQASVASVGDSPDLSMMSHRIPLPGGASALIRTSEPVRPLPVRVELSPDASEEEIVEAASRVRPTGRLRGARGPQRAISYTFPYDDPYSDMAYPEVEYRVLAAYRYWSAINFFYGYKHLISPWEPRLEEILERLIAAGSREEYELTLAAITLLVPDGHSWGLTEAHFQLMGRGGAPFRLASIEGRPIVTHVTDSSATEAGISPGDELLSIDERPIEERLEELRGQISAANEWNREDNVMLYAPRGTVGSESLMRFRRPDGSEHEATILRSTQYRLPATPRWRVLEGNTGYVDLGQMEETDWDPMVQALASTDAIIFDMRGYPRMSFAPYAYWLNVTGTSLVAQIRRPFVVGGEVREAFVMQDLGQSNMTRYRGKTFMLVGPASQSAAEHFALIFEAVADTTFVGSPTSGSNGNITYSVMPGANYMTFTGMDVRHSDGRQLQRVGIQPHVRVDRTIAGVAAGRDEVLEAALVLAGED